MSLHTHQLAHAPTILTLALKSFPRWAAIQWALILSCQIIQQIQCVCMRDEIHICQTSQRHDGERSQVYSLLPAAAQDDTSCIKPPRKGKSGRYFKQIYTIRVSLYVFSTLCQVATTFLVPYKIYHITESLPLALRNAAFACKTNSLKHTFTSMPRLPDVCRTLQR